MENQYVKKPIPITAQQMKEPFAVKTLEGTMKGEAGDWLITGVEGEQFPCKDSIFRKTYETVLRQPWEPSMWLPIEQDRKKYRVIPEPITERLCIEANKNECNKAYENLQAKAEQLQEALQRHAVRTIEGTEHLLCEVCGRRWHNGGKKPHAPGCEAAPGFLKDK